MLKNEIIRTVLATFIRHPIGLKSENLANDNLCIDMQSIMRELHIAAMRRRATVTAALHCPLAREA
jgi:hypothetical protein